MSLNLKSNVTKLENAAANRISPRIGAEIIKAVENLRYGSVEIIIHDAKVVQIEKKEKVRFQIDDFSI